MLFFLVFMGKFNIRLCFVLEKNMINICQKCEKNVFYDLLASMQLCRTDTALKPCFSNHLEQHRKQQKAGISCIKDK